MKLSENPFYKEGRTPYVKKPKETAPKWAISFCDKMAAFEVELLCNLLTESKGSIQVAADISGIGRTTLCFKIKKYALRVRNFK